MRRPPTRALPPRVARSASCSIRTPSERRSKCQQLSEDFDLSHEAIAQRVGKSRSAISNTLRLLQLPEAIQAAIADKAISEGHARALLGLDSVEAQLAALSTVVDQGLTVRQTEELVRRLSGKRKQKKTKTAKRSPEEKALEEELQATLGTRVTLQSKQQGGTITLYYYSDEELNALIDRLLEGQQ